MDTIMKWVQHVWWMFYALLFSLSFALSLYSSISSSFEKVWDTIIGRLALDKYWGWSCYGYLHKATRRMEDQWGYIVYAQDCGIWNLCCCIAGHVLEDWRSLERKKEREKEQLQPRLSSWGMQSRDSEKRSAPSKFWLDIPYCGFV